MEKNAIEFSKYIIAGGNPTLLVKGFFVGQKQQIVKKYLKSVDQIGFVNGKSLEMMGNELCINAILAYASILGQNGFLKISALNSPIKYTNTKQKTSIQIPLKYEKIDNIVLLEGIGFKFENLDYKITKTELRSLANIYNLPAFGIVLYKDNQIYPYIYVKTTDSLKQESACSSGSLAISLLTGLRNIKQPTGKIISVYIKNNIVQINSQVKEVIIL